jgi:hypothetical protein
VLVVVGGHSRNTGKTSVAAGLITALLQFEWTAIKITQHGHGICSQAGQPCDCAIDPACPYALSEESGPGPTDSGRFLAAGARRSFWLRTVVGQLGNALPVLREILASSPHTIIESNSVLQFLQPDAYVVVVDFSRADFKESALRYLDRADCIVTAGGEHNSPTWQGVAGTLWKSKPRFAANPPEWVTPALADFVSRCARPVPSASTDTRSHNPSVLR